MTLICGIFSPTQPARVSQDDLASMLAAAGHHARDGSASFLDLDAGIALGLSYTSTFNQRREPITLPWHEDAAVVAGISGTVWPADRASPGAKRDLPLLLSSFSQSPTAFAEELDGDFALFLWDRQRRELHLLPDAFAQKPVYYYYEPVEKLLVFSSELKSVLAHPLVARELDRRSLSLYLGLSFIPAPYSLIKDVRKIMPSEALVFSEHGMRSRRYWRPSPRAFNPDSAARTAEAEVVLKEAVENLTRGASGISVFLSGGVDSSVVLAAAKSLNKAPLHAVTIAYENNPGSYDVPWAERVAGALGCEQRTVTVNAETDVSPALLSMLFRQIDEPFESSARIINEHFLLQAALEFGDDSCLNGAGAGLVFARGRWLRYLRDSGGVSSQEDAVSTFIGSLTFFDADRQDRLLTWEIERDVFQEATRSDLPLMADLNDLQSATLGRVLRGPQSRLGLFSVSIPPLYGAEERSPLFDRQLVNFALSLPPDQAGPLRGGSRILATCFQDSLQIDFSKREKRAYPKAPLPAWLTKSIIGQLGGLVDEGLVNRAYIDKLAKNYKEGRKRAEMEVWQLFVFYCWYEFHIKQRDPFDAFVG